MQDTAVLGVLDGANAKADVVALTRDSGSARDMMQFVAFFAMMFWPWMRMR